MIMVRIVNKKNAALKIFLGEQVLIRVLTEKSYKMYGRISPDLQL